MDYSELLLILVYFLIGAGATALINKRKTRQVARDNWIKFIAYFVIVYAIILGISYGYQPVIAYAIVLIGLYEVVKVWLEEKEASWTLLVIALSIYVAVSYLFVKFLSTGISSNLQLQVYVIVLIFDGFSQIAGQLFGKTKIVPAVSPGKTLEGIIGGLFMAMLSARLLGGEWSEWFAIGFFTCIAAFAGDLLASWYKRKCGVKDYSNLIPGHGGVLDRFDSFLLAGAVWWILETYVRQNLNG